MAELFNITHDDGTLDEYDSIVTDSGQLSAETPGLAGTAARMEALIDDTNELYGQVNFTSPASYELRFRFYFDTNGVSLDPGDRIILLNVEGNIASIRLYDDGDNYELRCYVYEDGGYKENLPLSITDGLYRVEVHIERGAGTGQLQCWVNGIDLGTSINLDNDTLFDNMTYMRMGAFTILGPPSGTIYLDELTANDDGEWIGGELFNITHDDETLDEYDSVVTDGGNLSAETPGLVGTTARMEALINDNNDLRGIVDQTALGSNEIRYRFYFNTNGITMASGDQFDMVTSDSILVDTRMTHDGADYQVRFVYYDNGGYAEGFYVVVTDAEDHYAEVHIERGAAADGQVRCWLDGDLKKTWTGITNNEPFDAVTEWWMGAGNIDTGTRGTLYLDEFKANDEGSEIGPVAALSIPVALHHYRNLRT